MLHTLKFTEYKEFHDDGLIQVVLKAEFEGESLMVTSPMITREKAVDSFLDSQFRKLVESLVDDVLRIAKEKKLLEIDLGGMTFQDKISMFFIRQTVGFTNDVYKSCRNVEVSLLGIW